MFKSLKQLTSSRTWGKIATRRMNRTLKNLKITPSTHQKLKVYAAERGVAISDCADILLSVCLGDGKLSRAAIDARLLEVKEADPRRER